MAAISLLLGTVRWLFPERSIAYTGPRALLDVGFALGLLALVLLLAGGLGRKVQRKFKIEGLTRLEQVVFGLPIGLGMIAYGVLALSLAGLLQPWAILLWLILVTIWSWREWREIRNKKSTVIATQLNTIPPDVDQDGIVATALRDLGGEIVDVQ